MRLKDFNTAPDQEALDLVLACADVQRWAQEIVGHRPYESVEGAVEAAMTLADPWTTEEVDAALARHPRIGERAGGDDPDAQHSRKEQAGLSTEEAVQQRLAEGNAEYEAKFGHVFLIRAAGRSAQEILDSLNERLGHTPAKERQIAAQQLREIAALRLRGELS